jgi:23S rRNA (uracil1939-C5)-methyltransferase
VTWAQRNAATAGLANAEFVTADLAGDGAGGAWTRDRFRLALLDPPRAGARELLAPLAATGVERIVYVSCHPGTLARDAGSLVKDHGFRFAAAGVFDMFPQTGHVESLAVFRRDPGP